MRTRLLTGALVAALVTTGVAACSSDSGSDESATTSSTRATAPATTSGTENLPEELKVKPTPQTAAGSAAPAELQKIDIVEGTGAEAIAGDQVSVNYVGVLLSDGSEFDASWNRGQTFTFTLGAGQVIEGWDEGVAGMKVGGRRELVIPPDMGYGANGSPPVIPPNATLVFVVDLVSVN